MHPDRFVIEAIGCGSKIDLAEQQAREFQPRLVAVYEEKAAADLRVRLADLPCRVVSGMEGPINAMVVMVGTDGKPYTASLEGFVKTPLFFGEKMFDAGYYSKGEKREWTFYVWETDKKARPELSLDKASAKEFSIKTKPVMLDVEKLDQIKEGGKVPGLKVTLSTKGLKREGWELKQKSIRKVVSFKSKKYPKATPEVLVVGYWND